MHLDVDFISTINSADEFLFLSNVPFYNDRCMSISSIFFNLVVYDFQRLRIDRRLKHKIFIRHVKVKEKRKSLEMRCTMDEFLFMYFMMTHSSLQKYTVSCL